MPSRSVSAAYLAQAAELAGNPGQLAAYHSQDTAWCSPGREW
jgi:DNA helicase-2/ATP-dependent DNA helicase PcrA